MDNVLLGQRMRSARKAAHMSIEQAYEASGVSVSTIMRVEHGRSKCLYMSTVLTLCDVYGVRPSDILND